jgi:hypothetical protein
VQPDNFRHELPLEQIAAFCRRWKITKLALRGEIRPESDFDFLYTFNGDAKWGWEFIHAYDDLERLVGRRVDFVSRTAIEQSRNGNRSREILGTARVIYERGHRLCEF